MNTLLISYDLGWPETSIDYKKLIDYIKTFSYKKPLESFWFISTNKSSSDIRDELQKILDNNDKLLVMKVNWNWWASYNISRDVTDWMKENI